MANIKEIKHQGTTFNLEDSTARTEIGDLSNLETTAKNNLVSAINEARQSGGGDTPTWGNITGTLSNQTDLNTALNSKQETLVSGTNIKTINNTSLLGSGNITIEGGSGIYKSYSSENLWDGKTVYATGSFNYNTGNIDSGSIDYVLIPLEPNTDYTFFSSFYVLYPDDNLTYSKSNYHSGGKEHTINSGSFKWILFRVNNVGLNPDNPLNPSSNAPYWATPISYIITGDESENIRDFKGDTYLLEDSMKKHSFYRSVASKLKDLYNPLKPTSIAFVGDSITAGLHSAEGGYITNCFAKLTGDYIVEHFNNKIFHLTFADEHIKRSVSAQFNAYYYMYGFAAGDYAELDFYGSYIGITAGQTSASDIDVYIDGVLNTTFNFTAHGSLEWHLDNLEEDYHTIKIVTQGSVRLCTFDVKKKVTSVNKGVSGIASSTVRDYMTQQAFMGFDIIFLMIGTNDRAQSAGALGGYEFNVRQIFKHGQEYRGAEVILMSSVPSDRELWPATTPKSEINLSVKMQDIANWVTLIGGMENEETISFYNWLLDYATEHNTPLSQFFNDGLHPTEACHRLMYEHLLKKCGFGIENRTVTSG